MNGEFRPGGGYNLSDCSTGQGRVFNFTPSVSYRVSAVSLFFYIFSDSDVGIFDPNQLVVSLFEGSDVLPDKTLVFRAKPNATSPSFIAGNPFRGVLFTLEPGFGGPVWVEVNKVYTILLECHNILPDKHKIVGAPNLIKALGFDEVSFSANASPFSTPHFQLFSKNDGFVKVLPPTKTAPLSRPVIFVHALGGFPADFAEYTDLLKSAGWPSGYLLSFDYGLKDGNYNNYADLNDLVGRLSTAVATVSSAFKADGGDGKVDLVGYSSGSLLARNYLVINKSLPRVRRFISIAGAFKGSFLADLESGNENFPRAASEATAQLAKLFLPSLSAFNPLTLGRTPPSLIFKNQIISTSSRVSGFKKEDLPSSVGYYNLQGEIKATSTQSLFKLAVKSSGSLGDGAVLGSSTSDLPGLSSFSFLDSAIATRSVTKSSATVSAAFALPDFSKIKFFHSSLLKAQEIKNKILDLLK